MTGFGLGDIDWDSLLEAPQAPTTIRPYQLGPMGGSQKFQLAARNAGMSPLIDFSALGGAPAQMLGSGAGLAASAPAAVAGDGHTASLPAGLGQQLIAALGGSDGSQYGANDQDRTSAFGDAVSAAGPAITRGMAVGNPWLAVAGALDAAHAGYDQSLARGAEGRRQKAKDDAELAHTGAETDKLKADAESERSDAEEKTAQEQRQTEAYTQSIGDMTKAGAPPEYVAMATAALKSKQFDTAEKIIAAGYQQTPAAQQRALAQRQQESAADTQSKVAEAQTEAGLGFGAITDAKARQQQLALAATAHTDSEADRKLHQQDLEQQRGIENSRKQQQMVADKEKLITEEADKIRSKHSDLPEDKIAAQAKANVLGGGTPEAKNVLFLALGKLGSTEGVWTARKLGHSWADIKHALETGDPVR